MLLEKALWQTPLNGPFQQYDDVEGIDGLRRGTICLDNQQRLSLLLRRYGLFFTAKSDKGGQMTLQLYVDPGSNDRMLKVDAKDSGGFTYSAELKRTGDSSTEG